VRDPQRVEFGGATGRRSGPGLCLDVDPAISGKDVEHRAKA
jgi:hypothetical protein